MAYRGGNSCSAHSAMAAVGRCARCDRLVCDECEGFEGIERRCSSCAGRLRKRRRVFARVGEVALLVLLGGTSFSTGIVIGMAATAHVAPPAVLQVPIY